jgi:5-methylthioadenosine/S-adenosylhomocysteine deaminase
MDWLRHYIFPAEQRYVNREMVYNASRLAIAEMLLSGTTTFCDGYFHESVVARSAIESGMRIMACAAFFDFSFPEPSYKNEHREIALRYIHRWAGRSPLVSPALFCHSPYTCTSETIRTVKATAVDFGVPFFIHLAETRDEVEQVRQMFGQTPVRYLHKLGVLDENTVAVHCVWIDDEEINILGDYGVKVSHCPESNMKLASGICPLTKLTAKGITIGLGTDGAASNNDMDMFGEMDKAAKVDKAARLDPTTMNAKTVVKMATIEGAKVLGLEKQIGSIEPGKYADLIILDLKKPHLTPLYNPYSHLVYCASGADVSVVVINGQVVIKNRCLLTINIDDVMAKITELAEAIKKNKI